MHQPMQGAGASAPKPNPADRMVSVTELAEYLQLSDETIRRMARTRRIPSVKVAHRVRFNLQDVVQCLRGDEC